MRTLAGLQDVIGALRAALCNPAFGHFDRAAAGRLLGPSVAAPELLRVFFAQTEKDELYTTALAIEGCADRSAVPPLIEALLRDPNPHRRHAAARALGWIRKPGRRAARALAQCLADPSQPQPAREDAAESLAYVGTRETVATLVDAVKDPDVRLRFWATFALGGKSRNDPRAIRALESVLSDDEVHWWSVGREALAMLGHRPEYGRRLAAEIADVLANPEPSKEARSWAEWYMR